MAGSRVSPITIPLAASCTPSLKASKNRSGRTKRVLSEQACPQWPSTSPNPMLLTYSSLTSSSTTWADFPPNSRASFFTVPDAFAMMCRPVAVEPVKATMSTKGLPVSSSPTSPAPVMTFNTPGGSPASSAA